MDKIKILVIDDEDEYSKIVETGCALVWPEGCEIKPETRADRAFQTIKSFDPHLIILDIIMPGGSGIRLADKIRSHDSLKHIPLIFITATLTEEALAELGGNICGYPCLIKPFGIQDFGKLVKATLESKRVA